ncbi:hypothetical protein APHAL10511_006017 [Amanita phalloides]|nr:hypothetical protein APHAL10511_006017 [Amanita phalloides]
MSLSNVLTRFVGSRAFPLLKYQPPYRRHTHKLFAHDFDTLIHGLRAPDHLQIIHINYPALVAQLRERRKTVPVSPPLNHRHLTNILQKLGESGRPADLRQIQDILEDTSFVFGVELTLDVHTTILHALKKHGNFRTLYLWLRRIPILPGHLRPTLEQFHIVLEAGAELGTFKELRNMVLSMRESGFEPTIETFKILIRARWQFAELEENLPHIIAFSALLEDMKREGLSYNHSVSDMLFSGYADRGLVALADQIRALYEQHFSDDLTPEEKQKLSWNLKLSDVAQTRGIKAAVTTFRSLVKEGCKADPATVSALLTHSHAQSDLEYVEKELQLKPSVDHYSLLINNCIQTGTITGALALYDRARNEGLEPGAILVAPLIRHLCQMIDGRPLDELLDKAIALYGDFSSHRPTDAATEEGTLHLPGSDLKVYQALLHGLASSPNIQKYFPIALSLLEDMNARGLSENDSTIASSIIVLHMRNSTTPAEALTVYHTRRSALDQEGYSVVLNAYSKLTFGKTIHVPSLVDYFGIIKDMRHAGFTITTEVYTVLLRQLAAMATELDQARQVNDRPHVAELRSSLITTTRRTHDLLTLDANVSPDARVWNQLMNTYQGLGCFGDAYRVWELMYLSGRFDHQSVSIILDACGWARAWQVAMQVRKRLLRDKFRFDRHNWNTWIECLCRLGRLDDAVKVVCLEMGKNENVYADVESVRILLKFAGQCNQQAGVLSRIQRYLPDLWNSLPQDLQNS